MEKQRWDACVDCGVEKKTRKQRLTARCRPCGIRFAYQDSELRSRVAEHTRKVWEDPEHRERVSTIMKTNLEDPAMRERWRQAQNSWKKPELRIERSLRQGGDGDLERIERSRRGLKEYRSSVEGRWSQAVRDRDQHICQHCGANEGMLHAHHIKPRSAFPELALDINNGITLCACCHLKEHRRLRALVRATQPTGRTKPK